MQKSSFVRCPPGSQRKQPALDRVSSGQVPRISKKELQAAFKMGVDASQQAVSTGTSKATKCFLLEIRWKSNLELARMLVQACEDDHLLASMLADTTGDWLETILVLWPTPDEAVDLRNAAPHRSEALKLCQQLLDTPRANFLRSLLTLLEASRRDIATTYPRMLTEHVEAFEHLSTLPELANVMYTLLDANNTLRRLRHERPISGMSILDYLMQGKFMGFEQRRQVSLMGMAAKLYANKPEVAQALQQAKYRLQSLPDVSGISAELEALVPVRASVAQQLQRLSAAHPLVQLFLDVRLPCLEEVRKLQAMAAQARAQAAEHYGLGGDGDEAGEAGDPFELLCTFIDTFCTHLNACAASSEKN